MLLPRQGQDKNIHEPSINMFKYMFKYNLLRLVKNGKIAAGLVTL